MNRFSEDIDLTVKVVSEQSNTQNRKRLKLSALGYKIDGLELSKDECIDNKGSVTAVYKYKTAFKPDEMQKVIEYKRQEEVVRIGGIDENTQIKNLNYFKLEFSDELIKEFENMQNKYVLNDKYETNIDKVKNTLKQIYNRI